MDTPKIKNIKSWFKILIILALLAAVLPKIIKLKETKISRIEEKVQIKNGNNEKKENQVLTETKKVTKVIDGDTIETEDGQKVRYIGIDAPEINYSSKTSDCFAKEAKEKNKELVLGKEVVLEKDVSETDKYGRLLRYVFIEGKMINEILVQEGYALASTYPPDVKYQQKFLEAQKKAREENKGLWKVCQDKNYKPKP